MILPACMCVYVFVFCAAINDTFYLELSLALVYCEAAAMPTFTCTSSNHTTPGM